MAPRSASRLAAAAALATLCLASPQPTLRSSNIVTPTSAPLPVKVLIITMSFVEQLAWSVLNYTSSVPVPGLPPSSPTVSCTDAGICLLCVGMGKSNAAVSLAVTLFHTTALFDFRQTYFIVTGIAGVDPSVSTLGSAHWARYIIDFGLQWEIDARERPQNWSTGYLGINTHSPTEKPAFEYNTEVYQLNETLLQAAYTLSASAPLADAPDAIKYRSAYPVPGGSPPSVRICDSVTSDTWFEGTALGTRAHDWAALMTDGKATYCTAQQEDSALLEAIKRAASAGLADADRVAILRTGSDFDRPPPGGGISDADNLLNYASQGGLLPALENLYAAAWPLISAIVSKWEDWRVGVPSDI